MKKLITITLAATLSVGSVMSASAADFTDSVAVTQEETDSLSENEQKQIDSEEVTEADDTSAEETEPDSEEPIIFDENEDFSSETTEVEIEQEETDAEISDVETEEISTEEDFTDSEEEVDSVGTTSGICGKNVKWRISGSTLILSGSGEMVNYAGDLWEDQREYISKIEIGNNITTIASFAFRGFNNVRSITIGGNVSVIGT